MFFHGHASHFQAAWQVAEQFNEAGYDFVGFDQRGHGNSGGLRAYVPSFTEMVDDARAFIDIVKAQYPGKRLFALGESMGALVVLSMVSEEEEMFDAIMLVVPFLAAQRRVPCKCLLKCFASVFPRCSVRIRKRPSPDPLKFGILRFGTAKSLVFGSR